MANPYLSLFSHPGSLAFSAAAWVARMPISMTGIGIITMLSQTSGSYWLAGAVAATFTFSMALLAPQISRLVDRYGQRRVLPAATALSVTAMLALLFCSWAQWSVWTLFVSAALAGCMPSMSAMARARWTEIYRGSPQLHTAFSLESVLDEVCFIVGPPIAVGLSVTAFPQAGPLLAAVLLAGGVAAFCAQTGTEPPVHPSARERRGSVASLASMRVLILALLALGAIAGAVDVISVAFAQQQGQPAAASIVLSVYAIGSCLAGLLFGARKLSMPLPRLFVWAAAATALATLPLLLVSNLWLLGAGMLLAGVFFAPTMIVAMGLVEEMVAPAQLTEGLTWLITGLASGVALGAAVTGWVVDHAGVRAGFGVTLVAGVLMALIAWAGRSRLKTRVLEAALDS